MKGNILSIYHAQYKQLYRCTLPANLSRKGEEHKLVLTAYSGQTLRLRKLPSVILQERVTTPQWRPLVGDDNWIFIMFNEKVSFFSSFFSSP